MNKSRKNKKDQQNQSSMPVGSCYKHGKVELWLACNHVFYLNSDNLYLSKGGDALCFDCLSRIKSLTVDDLVTICADCLREIVKILIKDAKSEAEINEKIIGLENLKAKYKWN
jgi:hypothetical protein